MDVTFFGKNQILIEKNPCILHSLRIFLGVLQEFLTPLKHQMVLKVLGEVYDVLQWALSISFWEKFLALTCGFYVDPFQHEQYLNLKNEYLRLAYGGNTVESTIIIL